MSTDKSIVGLLLAAAAALMLFASMAGAQTAQANAPDPALVERAKEAVIKELQESGALDRAVDAGVERYVERQRAEAEQRRRKEEQARAGTVRPFAPGRDHVRGNPRAEVTLIEYSDFECPFCKRFHSTLQKAMKESNGHVKWVFRHFPIDQLHSKARKEAAASECAAALGGSAAFWKFADRFYELTPSNNGTDLETVLPRIARDIGLDQARFASCVASGKYARRVEEDYQDAVASGGRGTPWSIIVSKDGKTYPLSGAQSYSTVRQLIELARRRK
jgi:protein-disulfide isomerase